MKNSLFIGLLVVLSACSAINPVDDVVVEEKPTIHQVWQLKSIVGKNYRQEVLNNTEFNLENNNKAYAYMGCNRIALNYTIDDKISFKIPHMTQKKCNNDVVENDFVVLLPKIDNYTIEEAALLLKNQDKILMILELKTIQPL